MERCPIIKRCTWWTAENGCTLNSPVEECEEYAEFAERVAKVYDDYCRNRDNIANEFNDCICNSL